MAQPGIGRPGRPARRYEHTDKEIGVHYPPRRYDLLADLLAEVVRRLDPGDAGRIAEEVGEEYGRRLAAEIGLRGGRQPAVEAVTRALAEVGFGVTPSDEGLITSHCPFGHTADEHPEIVCRLDQGIVRGLMASIGEPGEVLTSPHQGPEEACVTEI